jgi:hypothetical protein
VRLTAGPAPPACRELIAADARGNVAAFTPNATELWERHVSSNVAQARGCSPPRDCMQRVRRSSCWRAFRGATPPSLKFQGCEGFAPH